MYTWSPALLQPCIGNCLWAMLRKASWACRLQPEDCICVLYSLWCASQTQVFEGCGWCTHFQPEYALTIPACPGLMTPAAYWPFTRAWKALQEIDVLRSTSHPLRYHGTGQLATASVSLSLATILDRTRVGRKDWRVTAQEVLAQNNSLTSTSKYGKLQTLNQSRDTPTRFFVAECKGTSRPPLPQGTWRRNSRTLRVTPVCWQHQQTPLLAGWHERPGRYQRQRSAAAQFPLLHHVYSFGCVQQNFMIIHSWVCYLGTNGAEP